jgi:hypothetical protein
MVIIEEIQKELEIDTKVDELNLLEKQLQLPAIKHKWVARLIDQKRYLNNLKRKKKVVRAAVVSTLTAQGMPPGLPKTSLDRKIEESEAMAKIEEEMENTELVITYLEKVETIFRSMTYDLKNIIEINKLETT